MANVIIGIMLVGMTFLLVSYGVWVGYERYHINNMRQNVSSSFDRVSTEIRSFRSDLRRFPTDTEMAPVLSRETIGEVTVLYGTTSTYGWVCYRSANDNPNRQAAFQSLVEVRGAVLGNACDSTATPNANLALTFRIPA